MEESGRIIVGAFVEAGLLSLFAVILLLMVAPNGIQLFPSSVTLSRFNSNGTPDTTFGTLTRPGGRSLPAARV